MTTQPETAVGSESPVTEADALQQLEEAWDNSVPLEDPDEDDPAPVEGDPTDEPEGDDDAEEGADDTPPIEAPISWDAEAKAKFAELPRDAQEVIAKRENERERFVQAKSQEAARAKQEAEISAVQQLAQYDAQVAQRYQQLAAQLEPQAPDPSLIRINPEAFYAAEAEYRAKTAQQQQLQQQAQHFAQQAQLRAAQLEQATNAEQHRVIVENFPEYADPTTGPELQRKLTTVAKRLGYSDDLITQARATDIIAMKHVAELADKADKYDALMKKKMTNVRQAKTMPPVSRPGTAQSGAQVRARNAQQSLEIARTSTNRDEQGAAFFDYLKSTGQVR